MSGPHGPMWFDPAPPGYPWPMLIVPVDITSPEQAEILVDQIKEAGNDSLRRGNNYDALWKYNHALVLCRNHNLPLPKVSIIRSNCAQACLNLKYYLDAFSHADCALRSDPHSVIVEKAMYRRAEATKMCVEAVSKNAAFLPPPHNGPLMHAIRDYCECFRVKRTNFKALCEAIILAVNNSVHMPVVFLDCDIVSGATTKVLLELLARPDCSHAHLNFLLNNMCFQGILLNHFDCTSIQFAQVCGKSLGKRLLHRMFSLGMAVSPEDVAHAVELLPDTKTATLDVIAANCLGPPCDSLSLAYVAAEKLKKPQLLECLVKRGAAPPVTAQEKVAKAKEEGNEFYRKDKYNEALAKYYQALPLCQQHKLEEEEALIRGNCAQVCLQLKLFKDAYEHANECLRLDPESSKGYYRRAEALRKMLESRDGSKRAPMGTSFSTVVSDYFQCHRKTENIAAIYQAIVVATSHNCTKSLPKLTDEEIASGLATRLLLELVQRDDSQQKHFTTLLYTLVPETKKDGIDASSLQVTDLLRQKSISSAKLVQRLLRLGMKVTETDVSSAVQILQECHSNVLQLMLKECAKTRKSFFTSACQEAIKAKKFQFIVCLIENGGLPDYEDLKDATGWPQKNVDPVIEQYLLENTQLGEKEDADRSDFQNLFGVPLGPKSPRTDHAPFVMEARKAHEEGKVLQKAGQLLLAQKKFDVALAVCQTYNLAHEACEIYYSFAKLHVTMGELQTAYTECTVSLNIRPTPKMYYLRANVLRRALSSPFHTVPPSLHLGMVVADYCESHQLKNNVKALTEAIIVAVNNRIFAIIKNRKGPLMNDKHVQNGFCTELLLNLLKHVEANETHVKVLITEMPIDSTKLPFDGSKVKMSVLFKRKFTHKKILEFLFLCGMKVEESDIRLAVETLAGDTSTLDTVCAHFNGNLLEALEVVCPIAVELKKIRFVHYFLKKGCKLPCTSQEVLTLALQKNNADIAESLLPFCTLSEVDLGKLMSTNLVNHHQLMLKMIDGGVNPNGLGKLNPLAELQRLTNLTITKRIDLICFLLAKGCDCAHLCAGSKCLTTPVHVATKIGLEAGGNTRVLDAVVASTSFSVQPDGKLIDGKGETPLHMAMNSQWKREHSFKLVKALVETHRIPIDPSIRNQHGKKATDLLTKAKNDKRAPILAMAANRLQQAATGKKKMKNSGVDKKDIEESVVSSTADRSDVKTEAELVKVGEVEKPKASEENSYEMMTTTEKLELHLKNVFGKEEEYFMTVREPTNENSNAVKEFDKGDIYIPENNGQTHNVSVLEVVSGNGARKSLSPKPAEENEMSTVMSKYGLDDFDGLPWEVEVTNNVLKFFKGEKEHPYTLRLRAARTVYELAEGKRGRELSKELSSQSSNLFEAKINKGGRIIWQKAVQFSPRRTGEHSNPIYAQVIRIWEIVPDHDQLNQTIKYCVKQIEFSNERGLHASLNVSLIPQKEAKGKKRSVRQQEVLEIPKIFSQADVSTSDTDVQRYTPAASPKEDEFNVTTFYSFSSAVLKSMLTGSNARRDFPFKEWPKEHEIINLPDTESILLLGRSGTGKTTCCLYRLWNEFRMYWDRPSIVMLPRKPLVTLKLKDKEEDVDSDITPSNEMTEDAVGVSDITHSLITDDQEEWRKEREGTEEEYEEENGSEREEENSSRSTETDTCGVNEVKEIDEHLHQVFVTKNYVLCAQMKKRFYDMAASHDFLEKHMDWELKDMPHSFADIEDYAYPLFVTARQFYILLDNSIGNGECFFRPREKDGSLKVKILSSDYDHEDPDTLLDLEDSESEGEDDRNATDYVVSSAAKQQTQKYVEVTSLYFTEHVWPDISHRCSTRHLDPLLVWIEIQSFIKGSRMALLKGSALTLEDYLKIGNKMAPNFANERETIYNLFKCYEEYRQKKRYYTFLFDECDLVHDIHRRLRSVQDLSWSIHSLYIDEVQDFTQAELALYLHCCRHPNSLFFTGDTAQSIMRGIAFRFQDLRSSFYAIHEVVPRVKVPQKPHTLTLNFRSHSGILQLAGSIIDLLQMFFTGSIDHLPTDKGMFSGPRPVILESCDESDLALLLSSNKRESSRIEFGAHQVVLVQSKEAKEKLPTILKGAIVLTIFESKGLEFDDVLLYNFFHDSMVDEKGWRVVTAYLEEHVDSIKAKRRLPETAAEPRSNKFDEKCHKALNSELKYLYTAITRAKCNLWIYDSNQKKRLPMFDLWYKRDLVKVVGDEVVGAENQHSLIFASISTPQQWKIQGDYFMRRSRWEQAKHCYDRAGPENQFLSVEANARLLVQKATRLAKPHMYLEAAVDFFYRDKLVHNIQCLVLSAQCLRRAKPQKFGSAALLFERLGKYGEAIKCYRKAKDTLNCVRLLEREGRYNEAVKAFRAPKEALAKASEYASKGIELLPDLMPDNLSYMYARHYANRKDTKPLVEVLEYMPDTHRSARFMKEGGLYNNALEVYIRHEELDDAYRLASGQCFFSQGKEIAQKHQDFKKYAEFVFHQVQAEYFIRNEDNKEKLAHLPPQFQSDLHALLKTGDIAIKAHASLLLGIAERDAGLCRVAHEYFLQVHNKVAALEAFSALTELGKDPKPTTRQVLDTCASAKEVLNALEKLSDLNQLVKQATAFYGVQKVRDVYFTPPAHNMWVSSLLQSHCLVVNDEKDLDGMLRLQNEATRGVLASHVNTHMKWLEKYQVQHEILQKLISFKLHDDIQRKQCLLRRYTLSEVPLDLMKGYIQDLINYCDLGILVNNPQICNTATCMLLKIFSPQVVVYLPLRRQHVTTVRNALSIHKSFHERVKQDVDDKEMNRMDYWLSTWRACTLSDGDTELVASVLEKLEEKVNNQFRDATHISPTSRRIKAPPAFMYWKLEDHYYHTFSCWLYSCFLIRDQRKPLWAAKQAIYHFVGTVAQRRSLSITVMNLVDVLVVHCMSIFAMLTHLNYHQDMQFPKFVVPLLYKDCIHLFDNLNCHKNGDTRVYTACADEVRRAIRLHRDVSLLNDCYKLLDTALKILLGTYRKDTSLPVEEQKRFKVLTFAFRNDKVLSSGAAHHCLVLALTLFANLIPYQTQRTFEETSGKFAYTFVQISQQENIPSIIREGSAVFQNLSRKDLGKRLLQYIGSLMNSNCAKGTTTQAIMRLDEKKKIDFIPLPKPEVRHSQFHPATQQSFDQMAQPSPSPIPIPVEASSISPLPPNTDWENPSQMEPYAEYPQPAEVATFPEMHSYLPVQSFDPTMAAIPLSPGAISLQMEASNLPPMPPHMAWGKFPQDAEYPQPVALAPLPEMSHNPPLQSFGQTMTTIQHPSGPITLPLVNLPPLPHNPAWWNRPLSAESSQLVEAATPPEASDHLLPHSFQPHTASETPPQINQADVATLPEVNDQSGYAMATMSDEQLSVEELQDPDVSSTQVESEPEHQHLVETSVGEDEGGDDEEAPGMSAIRASRQPPLAAVDPALADPSIVTEHFCNICGVALRVKCIMEDSDELDEEGGMQPEDDDLREIFDSHIRTDGHAKNYTQHSKFKEIYDGRYTGMVEELAGLITKCELTQAPSLARLVDDMKETVEMYDRKMSSRQNNLSWRMGINDIEKATEEFQRLLNVANRQYQKIKSEQQTLMGEPDGAEDSDAEFDAEINKQVQDIDDCRLEPRSEKSKIESRERKKNKKRKK